MGKILHLFRNSQFTEGYIKSINKYSKNSEHMFLVYGTSFRMDAYDYLYEKNVRYVISIQYELYKPGFIDYLNSFDIIIYHGVFENVILGFFSKNRNLIKKLYLYFWGGDIPLQGIEEENEIKKTVISEAAGIIAIVESDYKRIVDLYHPNGRHFFLQYADEKQFNLMKKYLTPFSREKKQEIDIQVGNSATETNNHINVLNKLEKYKNENIRIILPLSYGDKEYANEVSNFAKAKFGNKIIVLAEMMPIEEYVKLISKIDIGIFAMDRQQALGNIHMLATNGCKLFIKRGGQLDDYLKNKMQCYVSYIENIDSMDFEEFIRMAPDNSIFNSKQILRINETEYKMKKWNDFFEGLGDAK